ncbi:MAG TPA: CHAT domain-containing tetratricopeptide repeat protein [Blastocatellia bacterium]|nr:CHAT domain-containing tetratricopeptide repeat protein [Blastocatellia bacterium]
MLIPNFITPQVIVAVILAAQPTAILERSILESRVAKAGGQSSQTDVRNLTEVRNLDVGKPVEREMKGDESHTYQIALEAGRYLTVVVDQRGIDLVVRLIAPDGKQLMEMDSPNGTQGPERLEYISESRGNYQVRVSSLEKDAAPGRYEIRIVELRLATEADHALHEASKLSSEAEILREAGKYGQALSLAERSLAIREKVLGADHVDIAQSVNNVAALYKEKGDYARAEPLYQRALTMTEKALGPDHPAVDRYVNNLAVLYYTRGDYAKAEPLYRRSLAISEKAVGPDHPDVATSLNNLALLYKTKGDYERAEPLYRRALAIDEKALGPDHPLVATFLDNLGVVYDRKGDYARAEPLYQRALAIREKALGSDHPDIAISLNNLAGLYDLKGEYSKAEPLYQRALAIGEKALGSDHPLVGVFLNNLALLYENKGEYSKAEPLYERAMAIDERALGPDHPNVATGLNNLAELYRAKGDYVKAEPLYQRSLAIREKALGPDHELVALSLNNLGVLYKTKGEDAKAEQLYRRALAIDERALGPNHPRVAADLNNLAELYRTRGDYANALPLYQRSLIVREKALGPDHPDVALSLNNLAELYESKDRATRAVAFRRRATDISERNIALNLATGSERQKLAYLATLAEESNSVVSLHARSRADDPAARRLALVTVLRRKGRALDAMTDGIAALRRRLNAQDRALIDQLTDARSRLATLVLKGPGKNAPAEHPAEIKSVEEQIEKLESEISARSAEYRAQSQAVTIQAVQAAVPSDGVLVEFVSYRPFKPRFTKHADRFGDARYVAYVLGNKGEPKWVDLGEAKLINSAVDSLRKALRDPNLTDVKRRARAVEQKVFRPVRKLIGDTRRVLLSPDGALNLIPFAALVDERNRYLVQRYSFTYLTSGRDLLRLREKVQSKQGMVILGNPDYGPMDGVDTERGLKQSTPQVVTKKQEATTTSKATAQPTEATDFSRVRFPALPGTQQEVEALKAMMPGATLWSWAQATEAAVKQVAAPAILHIATHGFFLEDLALGSASDERGLHIGGSQLTWSATRVENPLLRSGLALAGANLHKGGDDDGILTALEVAGLDLWGTKLVVFSACETGVGEVRSGDGVYGLRRALVLAGSESQMLSLWKVDDEATRDLMIDYYTRSKGGTGRSEALRQVQLKMLASRNRRHPYFWASFIQSGEWRVLSAAP